MVTGLQLKLTQKSQSTADNTSQVQAAVVISWNGGSYNASGNAEGVLILDGKDYPFTAKFNEKQALTGSETIYSKTVDIEHDNDGSKTLAGSVTFDTGTLAGTVMDEAEKTLTTIPRESTLGAADANIGAVAMIAVDRKSSRFTHTIAYEFGELSGYITASGGVSSSAKKLTATAIPFTVPESFYGEIPNSPTGTCTLKCVTYDGTEKVGSAKTAQFTVTAAKSACAPTVKGAVEDSNEATLALTGDKNILVRYMSKAKCTITATAKNSATIAKKAIGGTSVSGTSRTVSGVESGNIDFTATDSRGYTTKTTVKKTLVAYVKLTAKVSAKRTDPTSGKAKLSVSGKVFDGSFGAADNTLKVQYKVDGGSYVTLTPTIEDGAYTASASLTGLAYTSTHTVTVKVTDKLDTVTKTVTIDKGIPVFDWGEGDFAFHVPVSMDGKKLQDLAAPGADTDAATKAYADKKLPLSGGTLSGNLYVDKGEDVARFGAYRTVENTLHRADLYVSESGNAAVRLVRNEETVNNLYLCPDHTSFTQPLTVASGGTGASSAAGARENLGIGCAALYTGALSSGSVSFSKSYSLYVVVGRTASWSSKISCVIPAPACDGSKYQLFCDGQYVSFVMEEGKLTVDTVSSSGVITGIYGVR